MSEPNEWTGLGDGEIEPCRDFYEELGEPTIESLQAEIVSLERRKLEIELRIEQLKAQQ